jgi:raffinose/stachyose/melibiose transport system substrate-binding protein
MKMRLALVAALAGAATMMLATGEDQGKKEITVWSWFISSTMEKSIKAFEQKNPGLKVRYTYYNYSPQYITALKAGAASNPVCRTLLGCSPDR